MKDIRQALKLIEKEPEKVIYEDDYQTIKGNMFGPTQIKLKQKGLKIVKDFITLGEEKLNNQGIIDFLGVKVVKTNEVLGGVNGI